MRSIEEKSSFNIQVNEINNKLINADQLKLESENFIEILDQTEKQFRVYIEFCLSKTFFLCAGAN